MFDIFTSNKNRGIRMGTRYDSSFDYLKRSYLKELDKITRYYRYRTSAVPSNHLIHKIITHMDTGTDKPLLDYVFDTYPKILPLCRVLGITTQVHRGKVFHDLFFTESVDELLISRDELLDVDVLGEDWRSLQPVKFLKHPNYNIIPPFPDKIPGGGVAVMSIHIPMLMLQYHRWVASSPPGSNSRNFVYTYPLTNLMTSYTDISLVNRLMGPDVTSLDSVTKHPFHVLDYSSKVDKVYEGIRDDLYDAKLLHIDVLSRILAIVQEDMYEVLTIPDMESSRQSAWVDLISRAGYMSMLLQVAPRSVKMNKAAVNRANILLDRLERDNVFNDVWDGLSDWNAQTVMADIEAIRRI